MFQTTAGASCLRTDRHPIPAAASSRFVSNLDEALKIGTIKTIYFEGGEPTLYYPLLLECVKRAHQKGFEVGIVSNVYGALAEEDAHLWLSPLAETGLSVLSGPDQKILIL